MDKLIRIRLKCSGRVVGSNPPWDVVPWAQFGGDWTVGGKGKINIFMTNTIVLLNTMGKMGEDKN